MIAGVLYVSIALSFCSELVLGCNLVHIVSDKLGTLSLNLMDAPDLAKTRRPVYKTSGPTPQYLYHVVTPPASAGTGRWVLNDELLSDSTAIAYVDSWAVQPYFVRLLNDPEKSAWMVTSENAWSEDSSFTVTCGDLESSTLNSAFYFSSSKLVPEISGFYTEVSSNLFALANGNLFFYRFNRPDDSVLWIFGETPGEESGLACVSDDSDRPGNINKQASWFFAVDGEWVEEEAKLVFGNRIIGLYERQIKTKKVQYYPDGLSFYFLRNNLPIPALGLGTDGMQTPAQSIMKALRRSYRMLDTSQLSGVEGVIGRVFVSHFQDRSFPTREDVFIVSKVWPTDFGFEPVQNAVSLSLSEMHTDHIDLYLLQYPRCIEELSWMNCEESKLPGAGWRESWRALEKEYAEGRVLSIGVSNFALAELQELVQFAAVKPHVVQNYFEPGRIDLGLVDYCKEENIQLMAYSTLLYRDSYGEGIKKKVEDIAELHWRTPEAIILRSMVQKGVVVIPRSENVVHMLSNQQSFTWDLTDEQLSELGW